MLTTASTPTANGAGRLPPGHARRHRHPVPQRRPAGWPLHVDAGVGQGGREHPEHLGAAGWPGHAEGVLGIGREGKGVTLLERDLLRCDGELQLPGQDEDELNVRGQRVGLVPAAAARLDVAEDGLDPLLAGRLPPKLMGG